MASIVFFVQAEDGIRDLVRSRGLGDVYKRQLFRSLDGGSSWIDLGSAPGNPDVHALAVTSTAPDLSLIHI